MHEQPLPLGNTILRILTFRATGEEFERLDRRFLIVGLVATWIVGIGRYWDSPNASLPQYLGIGSVIYVFALSLMLYIVGLPLGAKNWSYGKVLTFITLTSFPAMLYALPVERWTTLEIATQMNVWFLAVVAVYRVALYFFYMARSAKQPWYASLTAVFLPITLIISVITFSGYAGKVFEVMSGLRQEPTPQDGVYNILVMISLLSILSLPVWFVIYLILISIRMKPRREV